MGGTPAIWFWMFVGSLIGSFLPDLWGAGLLSLQSFALGAVGALLGIWIGYRTSF